MFQQQIEDHISQCLTGYTVNIIYKRKQFITRTILSGAHILPPRPLVSQRCYYYKMPIYDLTSSRLREEHSTTYVTTVTYLLCGLY